MMLSLGPIIFGLILGLIIGSQIKLNVGDSEFTLASFVVIFIAGIIIAWLSGNFPYYDDVTVSTAFLSPLIGIFVVTIVAVVVFTARRNKAIKENGIETNAVVSRIEEDADPDNNSYTYYVTYTTRILI